MPNFHLDPSEEELVTHVRMMCANVRMEITAKQPDLEALKADHHALGVQAGWVLCLQWMQGQVAARQAVLGPYEDTRTLADMAAAVADKLREVQAG